MRDIALTLLVFGSLPFILRRPYIGVLMWSWLSYMNPHRLTYGFAYYMPYAQIVAVTLFLSLFFTKEKLSIPRDKILSFWLAFIIWMGVSTIFAIYAESASIQLVKVFKIQLITLFTLMLVTNAERINQLIWVIVLSIGFFSTKGGLFTLMTAGAHRVWGPPGSYIEENNSLAVATLMVIPLMIYLYQLHKNNQWLQRGILVAVVLSTVSVFGSQSRGALVAVTAVGLFFWLKSKAKFASGLAIVLLGVLILSFMPATWFSRMDSIQNYEEDTSAMGRLNAWEYSINLANDRLTGGGFESWSTATFIRWAPNPQDVHAAHSIYFGVLADHGWPGLLLLLLILLLAWLSLSKTIRLTHNDSNYSNQNLMARMLQVSLIAYASGGAFLSLAYFDLPWHIIAIAILLSQQVVWSRDESGGSVGQSVLANRGSRTAGAVSPSERP